MVAAAVLVVGLVGCKSCRSSAVVARLGELQGTAARELAAKHGEWTPAGSGSTFELGDAVRTDAATNAKVTLEAGGALKLGPNTTVRFVRGTTPATTSVGVETGEAEIEAGGSGLGIETTIGSARLEAGSRVQITANTANTGYLVLVGRALIEGDGGTKTIEAGERFSVSTGAALIEPAAPKDAAVEAAAPPAPAADAAADAPALLGTQVEVHGSGVRTATSDKGPLVALPAGSAQLQDGARLVVPEGASVELSRGAERAVVVGAADVSIGAAGGPLLQARSGRVTLTSPTAGTRVDVPGGSILLVSAGPGNVQAQVIVDGKSARVVSNQGKLELRGRAGAATVGAGETGSLDSRGVATKEEEAQPSAADVTVTGKESPVIHSPRGNAAVRIRFDHACPGDAVVEVSAGTTTHSTFARGGAPSAIVGLLAGAYKYAVRCVGDSGPAQQTGVLRILRDSGAARLARIPPANVIDSDGRRYSVLYQNLLPQIRFQWPQAPAGSPVSLRLERTKGQLDTYPATSGAVDLPAGTLHDGIYRFWFEVTGKATTRSPETTLKISFDNAAPAAEIHEPADGQPSAATIHVSGVAIEGATVSVAETALPLDPQLRFDGDVPGPPAGDRSLAIRIAHPAHGVHYYLRMIGGP